MARKETHEFRADSVTTVEDFLTVLADAQTFFGETDISKFNVSIEGGQGQAGGSYTLIIVDPQP